MFSVDWFDLTGYLLCVEMITKDCHLLLQVLYRDILLGRLLLRCLEEAVLLINDFSESLNLFRGIDDLLLQHLQLSTDTHYKYGIAVNLK